ncbi:hypothetical protein F2Q69_00039519 [Brassica cretica]|uniref:DUF6737 domain-containing protein n=1 Tax=Brassica cretica TaxID=69181 RepID=A0A8S9NM91_BRACR|nr:hypothetical protein F2Q69_00039519 [Brassica cretica]
MIRDSLMKMAQLMTWKPWTIMVTGLSIVACSWVILHSVLVSSLAVGLVGAWWYIFLYSYPKSYSEMIAERRKRVADGFEDTYGKNKTSDLMVLCSCFFFQSYSEMIAERRKRVAAGFEDIYGKNKTS